MKKRKNNKDIINKSLLISLILFQYLDAIFTYLGIEKHGIFIEANPLIRNMISNFGYNSLFFIKSIAVLILVFGLLKYDIICKIKFFKLELILLNIIYLYVVVTWFIFLI